MEYFEIKYSQELDSWNIGLATKWLWILSLSPNDKSRNHLVANTIHSVLDKIDGCGIGLWLWKHNLWHTRFKIYCVFWLFWITLDLFIFVKILNIYYGVFYTMQQLHLPDSRTKYLIAFNFTWNIKIICDVSIISAKIILDHIVVLRDKISRILRICVLEYPMYVFQECIRHWF